MARKKFVSFDYRYNGTAPSNGTTYTAAEPALPPGVSFCAKNSDTTFFEPGGVLITKFIEGRDSRSSGYGEGALLTIVGSYELGNFSGSSVSVTRSSIGSPQEIWATFDIRIQNPGQNLDNPSSLMQSAARFQVFKWGDLSLRLRRIYNYQASPLKFSYQFEAFNGSTSLGTIALVDYNVSQWSHVRIRARLDSGTSGRFDVSIDGNTLNTSNINSVAVTTLENATRIIFGGGVLGSPAVSGNGVLTFAGAIDNILIDDSAYPTGRPLGIRVGLASDGTLTNWEAVSPATTVTGALTGSGTARGTVAGATALLNLSSITTTGFESNLLGWQFTPGDASSLDSVVGRRIQFGIDVSGTEYSGIETVTLPLAPSTFVGAGIDTVFYKGGTTNFTVSDISNCKALMKVV